MKFSKNFPSAMTLQKQKVDFECLEGIEMSWGVD
jgi:hypothetical protein